MINYSKVVVFDMDETLGYFTELGMFWDAITTYIQLNNIQIKINNELFDNILDLYPEFLRPNIINILKYLKKKKENKFCSKIMIYTNNQGPKEWVNYIVKYFETKLNYKLFDQIIYAFKIKGKIVELCRTSHDKKYEDFIRCTKLSETTDICFLDDIYHHGMRHEKIYYINIKKYIYNLKPNIMIERFLKSNIFDADLKTDDLQNFINNFMKQYSYTILNKTSEAQNIDKILSQKILEHLHIFFYKNNKNSNSKTKRKKIKIKNKTFKKH